MRILHPLAAVTAAACVLSSVPAQNLVRCATPDPDPTLGRPIDNPDCSLSRTNPTSAYAPTSLLRIPIVVHVIQNSSGVGNITDAQVRSQIDVLNESFRALPGTRGQGGTDTMIEFYLATQDPNGNPTSGITRSTNTTWFNDGGSYYNALAWDTNRYLNIYSNSGGGALGYVPGFPQQSGLVGSRNDRVVVAWDAFGRGGSARSPFNLGFTAVHEVGHFLGLFHTFQGGCSNSYTSGDLIVDTNAESRPFYGCGSRSTCGTPDPVDNYMNYSNDSCMTKFTPEQTRRMRCTLTSDRPNLYSTGPGMITASATQRLFGNNPASLTSTRPVLGTTTLVTCYLVTTFHTNAALLGGLATASVPYQNYQLLIDLNNPRGGVLFLPTAAGPFAQWSLPIPNDPTLTGATLFTQAVHFGGQPNLALSNGVDLTFGPQ